MIFMQSSRTDSRSTFFLLWQSDNKMVHENIQWVRIKYEMAAYLCKYLENPKIKKEWTVNKFQSQTQTAKP